MAIDLVTAFGIVAISERMRDLARSGHSQDTWLGVALCFGAQVYPIKSFHLIGCRSTERKTAWLAKWACHVIPAGAHLRSHFNYGAATALRIYP